MTWARTLAVIALIGLAASVPVPAWATLARQDDPDSGVPSGPDDPRCISMPFEPQCQGGPYAAPSAPTSPADPTCATMPADPICAGGPYAIPTPPPQPVAPPVIPAPAVIPEPPAIGMPGKI